MPRSAEEQVRLGADLEEAGDRAGAVDCYRQALAADPASFAAYNNLGSLFSRLGDFETALTFLQSAVAIRPSNPDIYNNLGNVYFQQGRAQPAIDCYLKAIALRPECATYYSHLGNALRLQARYAEAEVCLLEALRIRPAYPEAAANLAFCFVEQGRFAEAEALYRCAIEQKPDYAMAHMCLGQLLLHRGDFAAGWVEQEWRWLWPEFPSPRRNFAQPQWKGEEIRTGTLLLHAEQGFGDTIQCLRYVALVRDRLPGVAIILEVHPELKRLAAGLNGVACLLARGEVLPEFDWHCPLMSLPLAFATEMGTIPTVIPYLSAEPEASEFEGWTDRIVTGRAGLRVGVVWAGEAGNRADDRRSMPLTALEALWRVPGIDFYSLQRGAVVETPAQPFAGKLAQEGDFAMTASAMRGLDLVIAVDTAVAHLAGSLGLPVWLMLPASADWRWLVDREDSPWYPTARLFRQKTAGDWRAVADQIALELGGLVDPLFRQWPVAAS